MRTRNTAFLASAGALVLIFSTGAPAYADITAGLPAGERLYAVECEDNEGGFGTIDVMTGLVTLIGTGTADPNVDCAGMAAYNPVNGLGYWSTWESPGDLFSVNLTTGAHTFVGHIAVPDGDPFWLEHMAIGPNGVGYGIAQYGTGSPQLVRIDLATAEATIVAEFGSGVGSYQWWSFAYNPADGHFYTVSSSTLELYRVNVDTGALTSLGIHGDEWAWYGISFDSEGTIWSACVDDGLVDNCVLGRSSISTWTTPGTSELGEETYVGQESWFTEATFIPYVVPAEVEEAPQLADTGAAETTGLTALAALFLIVGAVFVVARRRA